MAADQHHGLARRRARPHRIFAGLGERIELTHRAQSGDYLARGALRAAPWLINQPAGRYGMHDVLGWTPQT